MQQSQKFFYSLFIATIFVLVILHYTHFVIEYFQFMEALLFQIMMLLPINFIIIVYYYFLSLIKVNLIKIAIIINFSQNLSSNFPKFITAVNWMQIHQITSFITSCLNQRFLQLSFIIIISYYLLLNQNPQSLDESLVFMNQFIFTLDQDVQLHQTIRKQNLY